MSETPTIGDVLSRTLDHFQRGWQPAVIIGIAVYAVVGLLVAVIGANSGAPDTVGFAIANLAVQVILAAGAMLVAGAMVELGRDMDASRPVPSAGDLLGRVTPSLGPLTGTVVLISVIMLIVIGAPQALFTGIGIGALAIILLPVAVALQVYWSLVAPVVVVENTAYVDALSRSWELVKGAWLFVFGSLLVVSLIVAFGGLVIGYFLAAFMPGRGMADVWIGMTGLGALMPVVGLAIGVVYNTLSGHYSKG